MGSLKKVTVIAGGWRARAFGIGLVLVLLWAGAMPGAVHGDARAYRAAVESRFAGWIEDMKQEVRRRGIAADTFERAMQGVSLDWSLPDLAPPDLGPGAPARPRAETAKRQKQQAEFNRPSRYFPPGRLSRLAAQGRQLLAQWRDTLERIEAEYGVDKSIVLSVWGRETAFGRAHLPHYAVEALATQAFMGRRKAMFRRELMLALEILEAGHVAPAGMRSSWAGAMGHTQFLPSDFRNYAVDFDGDGRRDIWNSIPDALASTANALRKNGWEAGKTWGYEVRLPEGFDCTLEGVRHTRPIREWVKLGLRRTYDREFPKARLKEPAHLVLPAGVHGPAFLALKNFLVLKSYNMADTYALFVGHVADRIYNDRDFESGWTPVDSFTRAEVRRLQIAMREAGIKVGKLDGLIGGKVRAAVGAFQRELGRPVTCYPKRSLLKYAAPSGRKGP